MTGPEGNDGIYLSFDQDWTPTWATHALIARLDAAGKEGTLFVTNACEAVSEARRTGRLELAWHPNFLAGSTHGGTEDEVLETMGALVPEARGVRAHCLVRSTPLLLKYGELGIVYEASDLLFGMPNIQPLVSWNGVVRLPIYWEDDVHLLHRLPVELDEAALAEPGLKVFNFHPTLIALNAADLSCYEELKADLAARGLGLFDATEEDVARHREPSRRGVGDVFETLLNYLAGHPERAGGQLGSLAARVRRDKPDR